MCEVMIWKVSNDLRRSELLSVCVCVCGTYIIRIPLCMPLKARVCWDLYVQIYWNDNACKCLYVYVGISVQVCTAYVSVLARPKRTHIYY